MKVLDLFSGIGGFSLGLERAGMETIAFCEQDIFCQRVLAKHWPTIPICADIHKLSYIREGDEPDDWLLVDEELNSEIYRGKIDVICGGFPCQPFSVAGKQKGKSDERHLWPEMFRLIREVHPDVVVGENVTGFVDTALDECIADLASEGYEVQTFLIPACGVGADHRRERSWIVAYATGERIQGLWTGGEQEPHTHDRTEVFVCGSEGLEHSEGDAEPGLGGTLDGLPTWMDGFEYAGNPDRYGTVRVTERRDNRANRVKALGNSVQPQIPEIFGRAIMYLRGDGL